MTDALVQNVVCPQLFPPNALRKIHNKKIIKSKLNKKFINNLNEIEASHDKSIVTSFSPDSEISNNISNMQFSRDFRTSSARRKFSLNVRRLQEAVNLLLSDKDSSDRSDFIEALNEYHLERNIFDFTQSLRVILNTAAKRQLISLLRKIIPPGDVNAFDKYMYNISTTSSLNGNILSPERYDDNIILPQKSHYSSLRRRPQSVPPPDNSYINSSFFGNPTTVKLRRSLNRQPKSAPQLLLNSNYNDIKGKDRPHSSLSFLRGSTRSLKSLRLSAENDPTIRIVSYEPADEELSTHVSIFDILGFDIRSGNDRKTYISHVNVGTWAEKESIMPGDCIVFVNDICLVGKPQREVTDIFESAQRIELILQTAVSGEIRVRERVVWVDINGRRTSPPTHEKGTKSSVFHYSHQITNSETNPIRHVTMNLASGQSLGLIIRGGSEYNLGIYVTGVDPGSISDRAGIKVGDQILEINNQSLFDVSHAKAVELIRISPSAVLTLRFVGKIPFCKTRRVRQLINKSNSVSDTSSNTTYNSLDNNISPMAIDNSAVRLSNNSDAAGLESAMAAGEEIALISQNKIQNDRTIFSEASMSGIISNPLISLLEDRLHQQLNQDERGTFRYYLNQYQSQSIGVEQMILAFTELLNTPSKFEILSNDLRGLISPKDLKKFDRLVEKEQIKRWANGEALKSEPGVVVNGFSRVDPGIEVDVHSSPERRQQRLQISTSSRDTNDFRNSNSSNKYTSSLSPADEQKQQQHSPPHRNQIETRYHHNHIQIPGFDASTITEQSPKTSTSTDSGVSMEKKRNSEQPNDSTFHTDKIEDNKTLLPSVSKVKSEKNVTHRENRPTIISTQSYQNDTVGFFSPRKNQELTQILEDKKSKLHSQSRISGDRHVANLYAVNEADCQDGLLTVVSGKASQSSSPPSELPYQKPPISPPTKSRLTRQSPIIIRKRDQYHGNDPSKKRTLVSSRQRQNMQNILPSQYVNKRNVNSSRKTEISNIVDIFSKTIETAGNHQNDGKVSYLPSNPRERTSTRDIIVVDKSFDDDTGDATTKKDDLNRSGYDYSSLRNSWRQHRGVGDESFNKKSSVFPHAATIFSGKDTTFPGIVVSSSSFQKNNRMTKANKMSTSSFVVEDDEGKSSIRFTPNYHAFRQKFEETQDEGPILSPRGGDIAQPPIQGGGNDSPVMIPPNLSRDESNDSSMPPPPPPLPTSTTTQYVSSADKKTSENSIKNNGSVSKSLDEWLLDQSGRSEEELLVPLENDVDSFINTDNSSFIVPDNSENNITSSTSLSSDFTSSQQQRLIIDRKKSSNVVGGKSSSFFVASDALEGVGERASSQKKNSLGDESFAREKYGDDNFNNRTDDGMNTQPNDEIISVINRHDPPSYNKTANNIIIEDASSTELFVKVTADDDDSSVKVNNEETSPNNNDILIENTSHDGKSFRKKGGFPVTVGPHTITIYKTRPTLGIAIEGGAGTRQPEPRIISIQPDGCAAQSPLKSGQILLAVDGQSLSGLEHKFIARKIAQAFKSKQQTWMEFLVKD